MGGMSVCAVQWTWGWEWSGRLDWITYGLDAVSDYFLCLLVNVEFDASDAASAGETTDRWFV